MKGPTSARAPWEAELEKKERGQTGAGVNQGPLESLVAGQCQVIAGPDEYRASLEGSPGWRVSQISCHDSLGVPPGYLFSQPWHPH